MSEHLAPGDRGGNHRAEAIPPDQPSADPLADALTWLMTVAGVA